MAASQDLQVPIFSFLTTKIEGGLSISQFAYLTNHLTGKGEEKKRERERREKKKRKRNQQTDKQTKTPPPPPQQKSHQIVVNGNRVLISIIILRK